MSMRLERGGRAGGWSGGVEEVPRAPRGAHVDHPRDRDRFTMGRVVGTTRASQSGVLFFTEGGVVSDLHGLRFCSLARGIILLGPCVSCFHLNTLFCRLTRLKRPPRAVFLDGPAKCPWVAMQEHAEMWKKHISLAHGLRSKRTGPQALGSCACRRLSSVKRRALPARQPHVEALKMKRISSMRALFIPSNT